MRRQTVLNWLIPLAAGLNLFSAGAGLFWQDGQPPFAFRTLHGQTVQMYGQGLYRFETFFKAPILRGGDAVTFFVCIPLVAICFLLYRRGSLRGLLVLLGGLATLLYNAASLAFSAAFNSLFLVYILALSASFFALLYTLAAVDLPALPARLSNRLPRRGIAIFMFIAGVGVLFIWLSDFLAAVLAGQTPEQLGPYTTLFTHAFDIAIIAPAAILTGIYLLRRAPLGYLLAAPMLVMCTLVGVMVIGQTIAQSLAGIQLPIGVYIGSVGSWIILGGFAIWLTAEFLRSVTGATWQSVHKVASQAAS